MQKIARTKTRERGHVFVWTDGYEVYVGDSDGNGLRPAPVGIRGRAIGYIGPGVLDHWYWMLGGNVFGADGSDA